MAHGHSSVVAKPFSPLSFSAPLWLDASDSSTITLASGLVSQWNNKGTLGGNFAQATSTAQPNGDGTYTQNGLRAIRFDGTNDTLVSSLPASSWKFLHDGTIIYFFAVVATENASLTGEILTTAGSNSTVGVEYRRNQTSQQLELLGRNDTSQIIDVLSVSNTTSMQILTYFTDFTNPTTTIRGSIAINNGAAVFGGSASAPSSSNPTVTAYIGSRNSGAGTWWLGRMCEIIIISGANATSTNATTIRNYLNTKWAVY